MKVSVVIPALDEGSIIEGTVRHALERGADELIVADGGSRDDTAARARRAGARLVVSPRRGRGAQMNAGAAAAGGDILLFLHADTRLPEGGLDAVRRALADPAAVGGAFRLRLDSERLSLRLIAALSNFRSEISRIQMGDRAIFARAGVFRKLGGYREVPLMEDVDLAWRLAGRGRMARLREKATSSARRWERRGVLRTVLLMNSILVLWRLGVPETRLARWYGLESDPSAAGQGPRRDSLPGRVTPLSTPCSELLLFARAPERGKVKTRLAAGLGEDVALAIYRRMVERVDAVCAELPRERVRLVLCHTPADAGPRFQEMLGGPWECRPQAEGDLGERLRAGFEQAFAGGAPAVLALGTDCIAITPARILGALEAVDRAGAKGADLALGPAEDGGYWCIAMDRPRPGVFEGIPWGTERVLEATLERARAGGLSVRLLETLPDIDRPEDVPPELLPAKAERTEP